MIDPIALAARLARMAPTGDVAEPVEYLEKLGNTMRDAAVTIRQLYDRVRELEFKLAACQPSGEAVAARECWRPIETAPKNGEYILMLRGTTVRTARWFDDWMFGESAWGAPGWSYPKDDQPTHWMPMPAPPAGEYSK